MICVGLIGDFESICQMRLLSAFRRRPGVHHVSTGYVVDEANPAADRPFDPMSSINQPHWREFGLLLDHWAK